MKNYLILLFISLIIDGATSCTHEEKVVYPTDKERLTVMGQITEGEEIAFKLRYTQPSTLNHPPHRPFDGRVFLQHPDGTYTTELHANEDYSWRAYTPIEAASAYTLFIAPPQGEKVKIPFSIPSHFQGQLLNRHEIDERHEQMTVNLTNDSEAFYVLSVIVSRGSHDDGYTLYISTDDPQTDNQRYNELPTMTRQVFVKQTTPQPLSITLNVPKHHHRILIIDKVEPLLYDYRYQRSVLESRGGVISFQSTSPHYIGIIAGYTRLAIAIDEQ